jgi:hypothetical protein
MSKRVLLLAALVALLPVMVLAACSGSSGGGANPDGGGQQDSTTETGQPEAGDGGNSVDASPDARGDSPLDVQPWDAPTPPLDASLPDGVAGPQGTFLVSASNLMLWGVTSDGYAVYTDTTSNLAFAMSITGATAPMQLMNVGANGYIYVDGPVIFLWPNANNNGVATLSIWTAANGLQSLSTSSLQIVYGGGVSTDGTHVLYTDGVDMAATTAKLYAASTDGSGKTQLLSGLSLSTLNGCYPYIGFAGSYAVAAHCENASMVATISSFSTSTWAKVDLGPNVQRIWYTDQAGDKVLVVGTMANVGVVVFPTGGGTGTTIDGTGNAGLLTSNGATVLYTTTAMVLKKSPVTTPAPTTLSNGIMGLTALSPDEQWLLVYKNQDPIFGYTDVFLDSAMTPGAAKPISTTMNATGGGDPFTVDSTQAFFYTNPQNIPSGSFSQTVTDMGVFPVAGNAATQIATKVWVNYGTSAKKTVFNANFAGEAVGPGRADIFGLNLAMGTTPKLLVSQAEVSIFPTRARDKLVYTWNVVQDGLQGLWIMPMP